MLTVYDTVRYKRKESISDIQLADLQNFCTVIGADAKLLAFSMLAYALAILMEDTTSASIILAEVLEWLEVADDSGRVLSDFIGLPVSPRISLCLSLSLRMKSSPEQLCD